MNDNYLHWNVVNWITIVLMVAVGMALFGMASSFIRTGLPTLTGAQS